MAVPDEQGVSPFPDPPTLFYKLYTDENFQSGRAPPPPVPAKGSYTSFGAAFDTQDPLIRSLDSQGITRLYSEKHDKRAALKKLNRSIAICFLELLDILIDNPASPMRNQKIKDLTDLFINMHHLVNEFRPHQARETLKVILERQRKQRDEVIVQVQRATEQARMKLKELTECVRELMPGLRQSEALLGPPNTDATEPMETSNNIATTEDSKRELSTSRHHQLIESQDSELVSFIDSLISSSIPL